MTKSEMSAEERAQKVYSQWGQKPLSQYPPASLVDEFVDSSRAAFTKGRRAGLEEGAKEADYYAKHSITAKHIATAIRSLKPREET